MPRVNEFILKRRHIILMFSLIFLYVPGVLQNGVLLTDLFPRGVNLFSKFCFHIVEFIQEHEGNNSSRASENKIVIIVISYPENYYKRNLWSEHCTLFLYCIFVRNHIDRYRSKLLRILFI